jgi:hypothetical protein
MLTKEEYERLELAIKCQSAYKVNGRRNVDEGNTLLLVKSYVEKEVKRGSENV